MNETIADLLDGLGLLNDFSYGELKALAGHLMHVSVAQDEVIFQEGDPGDYMLILIAGRIAVFKGGEQGRHLLSHEGRGRVIGEMALLDHELRSATCVAETACEFLTIGHASLDRMAAAQPQLAYKFMFSLARLLSRRLRMASGLLVEYLPE